MAVKSVTRPQPGAHPAALRKDWHYHFLGIGGVGMSALAEVLHRGGWTVSGSDTNGSALLEHLGGLGIEVGVGHDPARLDGADAVVYSSALGPEHAIWKAVEQRGLPRLHRAEVLGLLTTVHRTLAVSGTHGKTTTSACLALVLREAGWDPTALIGGQVPQFGGANNRGGAGVWMVLEADESDGSFVHLSPEAVLLTNIEDDHLDHHGTHENLMQSFRDFVARLPEAGVLVYCRDDPEATAVAGEFHGRTVGYGTHPRAQVRVLSAEPNAAGMALCLAADGTAHELAVRLRGGHNALNLAGVFALATAMEVPKAPLLRALEGFEGVERRQQVLGRFAGAEIIDDYAHHPTEIRATLAAVSAACSGAVTAVFQPHLYSRTARLAERFAEALRPAARIIVTDVYAAREAPQPGVSGRLIVDALRGHADARYIADWRSLLDLFRSEPPLPGVLLIMGAGDITQLGGLLLALDPAPGEPAPNSRAKGERSS